VSPRTSLIVIAKAPVPGRVKTRLCPPCSPVQAAAIARAALADSLAAVSGVPAARRVLALDGSAGAWVPPGVHVIAQRGRLLATRIAHAFEQVGGPAVLIGMDTPQVTPELLSMAVAALDDPDVDAVFGPASDGGWWLLGLRAPDPGVFAGIATSTATTGAEQRQRLGALGLRTREVPMLRDVDSFADARAVAATVPGSRFAAVVAAVEEALAPERLVG
jgi:rSAM/selenodomain-associated transferase 1